MSKAKRGNICCKEGSEREADTTTGHTATFIPYTCLLIQSVMFSSKGLLLFFYF